MVQNKFLHSQAQGSNHRRDRMAFRIPLVELCGRKRVLIENHLGIHGYTTCEIIIKVCFGFVYVHGENLKVTKICKEKLVISGIIDAVHF